MCADWQNQTAGWNWARMKFRSIQVADVTRSIEQAMNNFQFEWRVDAENWLLSPLGTRVAKVEDGALKLYDKHAKTSFSFTVDDFRRLLTARAEQLRAAQAE